MPARGAKFKMRGGSQTCPPGFHCMDTGTILLAVLLILAVVAAVVYMMKQDEKPMAPPQRPTVVVVERPVAAAPLPPPEDPRFRPSVPERNYAAPPDLRGFPSGGAAGIPINEATRGVPDSFQQVGLLTTPGGTETSASPTRTILPLFGRKLMTNRDRWNYYTRTDGINPVQVPVQFKRRNCDEDLGCEEITEGDTIGVPVLGQSFVASVYRYSTPRYIPMV